MKNISESKLKKIFIIVSLICLVVVLIEVGLYFYLKQKAENSIMYYDAHQMVVKDGDIYVAVGSSDFKNSKHNDYTDGLEKGKLVTYNSDGDVLLEVQYDKGINSTFTSVLVINDGYLVTGSGEYSDYQQENNIRDAFLIKYDKSGNKVWEKYYGVLSNTRFNKVIEVKDGYIVIGQSIYESMEVGNHTTGGGVIVKYDFDGNEVWHNNHGGNKSGNFNDIIEIDGNFYVVGKDASDFANLIKYDENGKYIWHKNYSYTDSLGFQSIAYHNDKLYVAGSKKILEDEEAEDRSTDNISALIVIYDMKGNKKDEVLYAQESMLRFESVEILNDNLYAVGVNVSKDKDTEEEIADSFILKYDMELELVDSKIIKGNNNEHLTNMVLENNKLYVSGYSNSKDSEISYKSDNGKDYFGKVLEIDENLKLEVIR